MIHLKPYLEMTNMMILATKDNDNYPYTSNVYFGYDPENYTCYFISRLTREHSQHIITRQHIAWSIVNSEQWWDDDSNKKWLQFQWIGRLLEWTEAQEIFDIHYQPRIAFPWGLPEWHHVFECKPTSVKIWDEELFGGDGQVIKL